MDGIAAIQARVASIQGALTTLAPPPVHLTPRVATTPGGPGGGTTPAGQPSTADVFAAALAAEVTGTAPTAPVGPALPTVPGFTAEQIGNARAIVDTGKAMGLSLRDQALGVMTAMGESSLRVLDHGDKAGPDSRGLFQQRDNGAWGTLAERMDPEASSRSFFTALTKVGARDSMTPTAVAHAVQRNADPNHYARYWDDAVRVVTALTGASAAQVAGR
ncbi:hypothetical protein [Cellulomonas bogoriensis]|uniref:Amidase n=1 Tax=Cellulomonas bogoriensis 69B4 = DSM 16987 TaxID=1386082 RepID=A0A0A0C0H9_9CELL|nr:hypothetical protein [Cellulomonas bogoriensis]KGM13457.1 amidase [Cellulomonas bogoriensis 69B4 = DSM 16987]